MGVVAAVEGTSGGFHGRAGMKFVVVAILMVEKLANLEGAGVRLTYGPPSFVASIAPGLSKLRGS